MPVIDAYVHLFTPLAVWYFDVRIITGVSTPGKTSNLCCTKSSFAIYCTSAKLNIAVSKEIVISINFKSIVTICITDVTFRQCDDIKRMFERAEKSN